jgi:DNA helicase IV
VLPSLGESGVREAVLADLVNDVRYGAVDAPVARRVKGDLRIVDVLKRAIRARQRPLKEQFELPFGGSVLRLGPAETARVVKEAQRRTKRHNELCRAVEGELVSMLMPSMRDQEYTLATARSRLREIPEFRALVFRIWPSLGPAELLRDLFGSKALLKIAGRDILTDAEIESLYRPRAESLDSATFSDADVALLDEARHLLGPKPRKGGVVEESDDIETYGHIVVDEVQDLTPMQLRMVERRSLNGAMTVVGDIAQATGPFAPGDWSDVLALLPKNRDASVATLSVGYRIPRQIMEFAGKLLPTAAPQQTPPTAVREGDAEPRIVSSATKSLMVDVVNEARTLVAELSDGRVGIVCPDALVDAISVALTDAGVNFGRAGASGLEASLTVVPVSVVKGLEMDGVVVVEPTDIYESSDAGPRGLYVALTRSTQRLVVVHSRALPHELRA